jgi:hypothetical protein
LFSGAAYRNLRNIYYVRFVVPSLEGQQESLLLQAQLDSNEDPSAQVAYSESIWFFFHSGYGLIVPVPKYAVLVVLKIEFTTGTGTVLRSVRFKKC